MDDETKYGFQSSDAISSKNPSVRIQAEEETAVADIFLKASTIDVQPLLAGSDDEFTIRNVLPPANVESSSSSSSFSAETLDVVNTNNTAGQRIFLTKAT
jgi:hypothetical protein